MNLMINLIEAALKYARNVFDEGKYCYFEAEQYCDKKDLQDGKKMNLFCVIQDMFFV